MLNKIILVFDATEKDRDFWHNALSQVEELHPLPWANALKVLIHLSMHGKQS